MQGQDWTDRKQSCGDDVPVRRSPTPRGGFPSPSHTFQVAHVGVVATFAVPYLHCIPPPFSGVRSDTSTFCHNRCTLSFISLSL